MSLLYSETRCSVKQGSVEHVNLTVFDPPVNTCPGQRLINDVMPKENLNETERKYA